MPKTEDVLSEEVAYVTLNLMQGVTEAGSGARLRHAGLEKTNYIYEKVVTGYPYILKILSQEKQELPKIKVMAGLWAWYPIWLPGYG